MKHISSTDDFPELNDPCTCGERVYCTRECVELFDSAEDHWFAAYDEHYDIREDRDPITGLTLGAFHGPNCPCIHCNEPDEIEYTPTAGNEWWGEKYGPVDDLDDYEDGVNWNVEWQWV